MIPKQPVSMADVAAHTGVSIGTVSRALRGLGGVSAATRDRILRAADDLAYVISPEASKLSGGATGRVALLVPRIDAWYYATVVSGLERELRAAGVDVLLVCLPGAAERHEFLRTLPLRRKVDALVVVAVPMRAQEAARMAEMGVPVVTVGQHTGGFPSVAIDDEEAARVAVQHLCRIGHTRVAMIRSFDAEGNYWENDLARRRGYEQALAAAGLAPDPALTVEVPWGIEGGAVGMELLLSLERPPTAVFCHSDEVAIGALRTLRRAGVAVPGAVSVTAVDDHPVAELFDLTTVRQPVAELGAAAGRALVGSLGGDGAPAGGAAGVPPLRLVVRGTTAPPPPA